VPDEAATKCSNCDADFSAFVRRVSLYHFLKIINGDDHDLVLCTLERLCIFFCTFPIQLVISGANCYSAEEQDWSSLGNKLFYVVVKRCHFSLKAKLFDMRFCKDYEKSECNFRR
jgi:hypothetical protein